MIVEKTIETNWYPEQRLIETKLSGDVNLEDISYWKKTLEQAFNKIESGSSFKILINLFGFKPIDLPTHKKYRDIIPLLLANYNWKVGYADLFEEAKYMTFASHRDITCFAAAHVHQDEEKIKKYQEHFGREDEQFFIDHEKAKTWINTKLNT